MIRQLAILSVCICLVQASAYAQNCEIERLGVYLTDPDTSGTNIRQSPGGAILSVVKNDPSPMVELYVMFEVCKMEGNWLLVKTTNNPEEVEGWIHNSVVSTTLAAYSTPIKIYEKPSEASKIIDRAKMEQRVKVLASKGFFSKIEYLDNERKLKRGYVKNQSLCGSAYTTCN